MNILVISGSLPPIKCGVGDYTSLLANVLAKKEGNNVFVLTSKEASTSNNFTVLNIVEKWSGLSLVKTILQTIKEYKIDIVQYEFPTSEYINSSIAHYIILPMLLRFKHIKVVYTLHEFSDNSLVSKLVRIPALLFSNRLIIVDERYKKDIRKICCFVRKSKISLVPIASNIPVSNITLSDVSSIRKNILSQNESKYIISYFGFVNKSKRLDLIFEAMGRLKLENKLCSTFLIVGDFSSSKCPKEHYELLNGIIKKYNLENNIYITGFLQDKEVGKYIKASDAAILLFGSGVSIRNGSMLATLQEGVKIITTKPKYDYPLFHNEQFLLIENDINQVKDAILSVQTNKAKHYNTQYLNWSEVANKHNNIYEDVLKIRINK